MQKMYQLRSMYGLWDCCNK